MRVSGVITTFNRPEFLRSAIESALGQTYPLFELIVVDDASTIDLGDVLRPFAGRLNHVRLPINRGANVARNVGVRAATGDVIAFLDDDDVWRPDKIARQIVALGRGYEACLCGLERIDRTGQSIQPINEVTPTMLMRGNPFCGTSGLAARRAVLVEEAFDEELPTGQDWDIYIRLARRQPLGYVAAPLFAYRSGGHPGITSSALDSIPEQLLSRARVVEKHRDWLGESNYRALLAKLLLMYLGRRQKKMRFVMYAVRRAGFTPTINYLFRRAVGMD